MDRYDSLDESDVNVSYSLPLRDTTSDTHDYQYVRSAMQSSTGAGDALADKSTFYPLQTKARYMPPTCNLSTESKRIVRRAQDPILQNSPRVVHFLYEVLQFMNVLLKT
jgi:hypothetical protein